jgi:glycerophosphoryl diester phosphodiesterase
MNKRWNFLCALALLAAVACAPKSHLPQAANKADAVVAALHDPQCQYVVVVSHRGDWRNYPENSLPAIESVIKMGVDMMELDLKMTKDSVLVLMHDGTLDRTSTGHGQVSDYTYEELQAFDLKRGHGIAIPGIKIPTLRQALELCKDRITVNVDQGYEYYDQVLAITEELGVTDQILIKGGRLWEEVQEKLAEHPHNLMFMPVISNLQDGGGHLFESYICQDQPQLAYELCFNELNDNVRNIAQQVLDSGSKVWVNTIWGSLCGEHDDDKAFASEDPDTVYGPVMALGTSIIQTDRPEFLIRYLESKGRR